MGCSHGHAVSVQEALHYVAESPAKGLPRLLTSMKHPEHKHDSIKNVPSIFQALPAALASLKPTDAKAISAACNVIVECVNRHNEDLKSQLMAIILLDENIFATVHNIAQPAILVDAAKRCQQELVVLLKKVEVQAQTIQVESMTDCMVSTQVVKSLALAIAFLFTLDGHTVQCKQEFLLKHGLIPSIALIRPMSGIEADAKHAVVSMLSMLVDNYPEGRGAMVTHGAVTALRTCVETAKQNRRAEKDMQLSCSSLLHVCGKAATLLGNEIDRKSRKELMV